MVKSLLPAARSLPFVDVSKIIPPRLDKVMPRPSSSNCWTNTGTKS